MILILKANIIHYLQGLYVSKRGNSLNFLAILVYINFNIFILNQRLILQYLYIYLDIILKMKHQLLES